MTRLSFVTLATLVMATLLFPASIHCHSHFSVSPSFFAENGNSSRLFAAAATGRVGAGLVAILEGANVNAKLQYVPIPITAEDDSEDDVELWLYLRHVNNSETALMVAAKEGDTAFVKMLLENGADPDLRDAADCSALMSAAAIGHIGTAYALLEGGAKVTGCNFPPCTTELHRAAYVGDLSRVKLMINAGVSTEARLPHYEPEEVIELGRYLVPASNITYDLASATSPDAYLWPRMEYTALHLAAQHDRPKVVSFLLDHGASFTAKDAKGNTPLQLAIESNSTASRMAMDGYCHRLASQGVHLDCIGDQKTTTSTPLLPSIAVLRANKQANERFDAAAFDNFANENANFIATTEVYRPQEGFGCCTHWDIKCCCLGRLGDRFAMHPWSLDNHPDCHRRGYGHTGLRVKEKGFGKCKIGWRC